MEESIEEHSSQLLTNEGLAKEIGDMKDNINALNDTVNDLHVKYDDLVVHTKNTCKIVYNSHLNFAQTLETIKRKRNDASLGDG